MYDVTPRLRIRGMFRYLVLYLLKEEPLHGYQIIQKIKELLGTDYEPSPGIVYPTLQLLEDMDYVVAERSGRKTVYYITEKGVEALRKREADIELMMEGIKSFRAFMRDVGFELFPLIKRLAISYSELTEDRRQKVRESFRRLVKEVREILEGD